MVVMTFFDFNFPIAIPGLLPAGLPQRWAMNHGRTIFSQLMDGLPK